jgi:hypothetical protein
MCDHTNDPGGREAAMVVLDPGTPERRGRDGVWCDPCLVPLVKALNDGGVRTIASCCGHGKVYGSIALADGRWLAIMPDADWRAWDSRINETQEGTATQELHILDATAAPAGAGIEVPR